MRHIEVDAQINAENQYECEVERDRVITALTTRTKVDTLVIGGGLTGLGAAIDLAQGGHSVAVLESGQVGSGASGRNGGQVLVGYACGQSELERHLGREGARRAWDVSVAAVELVKYRMQTHAIAADWQPGALTVAINAKKAGELARDAQEMSQQLGFETQWLERAELTNHIHSPRYVAGVYDAFSGHLNPLKLTLGMAKAARECGVKIYEHSAVQSFEMGPPARATTLHGEISADHVVVAGNALLGAAFSHLLPSAASRIMPVGTYIAATQPLAAEQLGYALPTGAAVCDNQFVLDYFRIGAERRLLFGGGVSYSSRTPRFLRQKMQARIQQVFPHLGPVSVERLWGGYVDITMNRAPDWGRLAPHVYYAQGFSGHGVALSGMAGRLMAQAILGQASGFDLFVKIKHTSFPGGPLWRTPLLVLGTSYHRLRDALGY